MIETFVDLRQWFRERVEDAIERRSATAHEGTRAYLVELLAAIGVGRRRTPGEEPLALQLASAREAPPGPERLRRFREIGDDALCLAGLFADHLERRGLSHEYVRSMGGGAYESAGVLAMHSASEAPRITVYRELASEFRTFAEVLEEVRESTALRTPQDIVKLYDKWKRTGSPKIAERLTEEGVYPVAPKGSTLH